MSQIQRKSLLDALNAVRPGVANKDIVESMTYFYFSGTHVISYNDIISIQYPLKTEFSTFVKADEIFKVVSKLKTDQISFELKDSILVVKAKDIQSKFATINDEDISARVKAIKESVDKCKFRNLPENFNEVAKLCAFVASKNESEETLTSIHIKGSSISSTDNVRIAIAKLSENMPDMLLKASEVKNLIGIDPVSYSVDNSWLHFKNEIGCIFSIRKVKGSYPDVSQFTSFEGVNISLPKSILNGLDIASVFVDVTDPAVQISLKKGYCRIFKEGEGGEVDYRKKISYEGSEVNFIINPAFLIEMLAHSTDITIAEDKARLTSGDFTLVTALYGS